MKNIKHKIRKALVLNILLLTILGTVDLAAQGWLRHFTDSLYLEKNQVTALAANGNVVQGQSMPTGDFKLLTVDNDGILLWEKAWFPNNIQSFTATDLLVASDGGIVIGGYKATTSTNPYPILIKTDANGNELWSTTLPIKNRIQLITENDNGDIICIGNPFRNNLPDAENILFMAVNDNGNVITNKVIQMPSYYTVQVLSLETHPDQSFIATVGYNNSNNSPVTEIMKIDINGTIQSTLPISNHGEHARVYQNGDYLFAYWDFNVSSGLTPLKLRRLSASGTVIWDKSFPISTPFEEAWDIEISPNEEIYMIGNYDFDIAEFVCKLDASGTVLWKKILNDSYPSIYYYGTIDIDPDGNCYIGGQNYIETNPIQFYSVNTITKLDGLGNLYSGFIKGKVQLDLNQNCISDNPDLLLPNQKVIAHKNWPFLDYTDANGNYFINVDTGLVEIKTIAQNPINSSCSGPITLQLQPNDTIELDFLERPSVLCPHMWVDISTPRLGRCSQSFYYVQYCNYGTAMANNVQIEVELDPYLIVVGSSLPWVSQTGNTFLFDIGNVDIFECDNFTIDVVVDCDSTVLGQTHCAEAHIYPDSSCVPPSPAWDGSITDLNVTCLSDSVLFEIQNVGTGDMSAPQGYIVTEDNIIRSSLSYNLLAGEVFAIKYPSNGKTYRLLAYQSPGYFPSHYVPTIAIEGCGFDSTTMQYSTGFITQYSEDDVLDYLSIDCQENIGPYDPNDKRAEPKGYGAEHYIEANTDIEYHIRFQNVGTAPAVNVVIRDQLSPHLDPSSIQLGVSSHPYDFTFVNGNMMKFTFNNINLPDSTNNEPDSHGFIKFKIAQQPNLPLETVINNSAAIYFDFNEPVITNTTFHKIGKDFIQITINNDEITDYPQAQVRVYPNPFSETATLEVTDGPSGIKTFTMHDALGRTVRQDEFETSFQLARKNLLAGIYFFTIQFDGNIIKQGKLVIH